MSLTSSQPFWSISNGLPANYPSLQRDVSCDAVVIDGGITGAVLAVHLVEAGVKTGAHREARHRHRQHRREHGFAVIQAHCAGA